MENIVTNVNNYFKDLKFDETTHTYTKLKKKLTPVSYVLKKFTEEFDSDKMSVLVANKRGITKEEVLKEWEDNKNKACQLGTKVHLFGENYCRNRDLKPSNGYEEAIVKWYSTKPDYIETTFLELQMFSDALGIAGTSDMVFYNTRTGKFKILDYKTNADLFKNYKGKKMLKPFDNLLDNPYNKYQLQLSLYQILFEQTGYEIESRALVWIKPNGTYEVYKTEDYTKQLLNVLGK
jgi:hypothetical protein|nr:MAG TPA: ATP dependent helicase [Caudoviricetes sp.]